MRILADESIHRRVIGCLRDAGHDVEWVRERQAGSPDAAILSRSDIADLLLVTNDRDFGELIFHRQHAVPYAVIYSRLPHRDYALTAATILQVIESGIGNGQFLTIDGSGLRIRPMPKEVKSG